MSLIAFASGLVVGVIIMGIANFMNSDSAEDILDLTDGHDDE